MKMHFFLLSLFFSLTVFAQERIETDRPDQTESPFTVPKKWFQSEIGFNFEKDRQGLNTFVHPTILNKYGLARKFELRLITEFVSVETPLMIPDGNKTLSGLLPVKIGGKLALWEEKGWLPKTSLIFHVLAPKVASRKFRHQHWAPEFRFSMQHSLSEQVGLGYNLGAEWDGEDDTPSWIYTFAPGFNLGKKVYAYIESFGFLKKGEHPQHNFDGGFAYFLSNNSKIDLSGGIGTGQNNPLDYYIAIGFSFRIPTGGASSAH